MEGVALVHTCAIYHLVIFSCKVIAEDAEVPTDRQILPPTALNKAVASANAPVENVIKTLERFVYSIVKFYDCFI